MSNQLISSEYLYRGKIYYYLVKYPICPGNKQIYNEDYCYVVLLYWSCVEVTSRGQVVDATWHAVSPSYAVSGLGWWQPS